MIIQLTVAYVGFGGNIGDGEYFYSYSPNTVIVNGKDEPLEFVFSDATSDEFAMLEILTSDSFNQFEVTEKAPNGRSITAVDSNSHSQLTMLAIMVFDKKRKKQISCDPQILNVPD